MEMAQLVSCSLLENELASLAHSIYASQISSWVNIRIRRLWQRNIRHDRVLRWVAVRSAHTTKWRLHGAIGLALVIIVAIAVPIAHSSIAVRLATENTHAGMQVPVAAPTVGWCLCCDTQASAGRSQAGWARALITTAYAGKECLRSTSTCDA